MDSARRRIVAFQQCKENRKYPADPPVDLQAYRDSLYEIPQKYQHHLIPFNFIKFTKLELHLL